MDKVRDKAGIISIVIFYTIIWVLSICTYVWVEQDWKMFIGAGLLTMPIVFWGLFYEMPLWLAKKMESE